MGFQNNRIDNDVEDLLQINIFIIRFFSSSPNIELVSDTIYSISVYSFNGSFQILSFSDVHRGNKRLHSCGFPENENPERACAARHRLVCPKIKTQRWGCRHPPGLSLSAGVIDCDVCSPCTFPVACQPDACWQVRPPLPSLTAPAWQRGGGGSNGREGGEVFVREQNRVGETAGP